MLITLEWTGGVDDPAWLERSKRFPTHRVFHGSPLDNWHSILHRGLISRSGTPESSTGAVYGDGIYVSHDVLEARSYATPQDAGYDGLASSHLQCVGEYDLVLDPDLVKHRRRSRTDARGASGSADAASSSSTSSSTLAAPVTTGAAVADVDVPDSFYIVSDASLLRLRGLRVWCIDAHKPVVRRSANLALIAYGVVLLLAIASRLSWRTVSRWWYTGL
jgi:hypothetical protein